MREICSLRDATACGGAIRQAGVRDPVLLVLLFVVLLRTSHALAGELPSIAAGAISPDFNAGPWTRGESPAMTGSLFDLPKSYQAPGGGAGDAFSTSDFRPRRPSLLEHDPPVAPSAETHMLHDTSVWQRLADYRAHGRVRLLTLWETGGSSLSLQAGKRGAPSLQWTSRSMNRGGATRGLLDQLVSMAGANRAFKPAARPSTVEIMPRNPKSAEAGLGANK